MPKPAVLAVIALAALITGAFVEVFSMNGGQVDDVLFVPEPALPLGLLSGIASVAALARRRRRD